MGATTTPADNIFYDLVSIEYHALKGGSLYDQFIRDAGDHEDVRRFIEQVKQEDAQRAIRSHELIMMLTQRATEKTPVGQR
ncbi:hypothetical protein ACNTMW_14505 [Planosporangium sp. 12N6]|uniref:hypothetical protein n=1 Tax=Planosporangium spinosum TaxID=3402278 RepID=UPI003CF748E1